MKREHIWYCIIVLLEIAAVQGMDETQKKHLGVMQSLFARYEKADAAFQEKIAEIAEQKLRASYEKKQNNNVLDEYEQALAVLYENFLHQKKCFSQEVIQGHEPQAYAELRTWRAQVVANPEKIGYFKKAGHLFLQEMIDVVNKMRQLATPTYVIANHELVPCIDAPKIEAAAALFEQRLYPLIDICCGKEINTHLGKEILGSFANFASVVTETNPLSWYFILVGTIAEQVVRCHVQEQLDSASNAILMEMLQQLTRYIDDVAKKSGVVVDCIRSLIAQGLVANIQKQIAFQNKDFESADYYKQKAVNAYKEALKTAQKNSNKRIKNKSQVKGLDSTVIRFLGADVKRALYELTKESNPQEALNYLKEAACEEGADAAAIELGMLYCSGHQYKEAQKIFEALLDKCKKRSQSNPKSKEFSIMAQRAALCLAIVHQLQHSSKAYEYLALINPADIETIHKSKSFSMHGGFSWIMQGQMQNESEKSLACYRKIIKNPGEFLSKDYWQALRLAVLECLFALQDYQQAEDFCQQALQKEEYPKDFLVFAALATLFKKDRNLQQAQEYLCNAMMCETSLSSDARYYARLYQARLDKAAGNYKKAEESLLEFSKIKKYDLVDLELGILKILQGDLEAAKHYVELLQNKGGFTGAGAQLVKATIELHKASGDREAWRSYLNIEQGLEQYEAVRAQNIFFGPLLDLAQFEYYSDKAEYEKAEKYLMQAATQSEGNKDLAVQAYAQLVLAYKDLESQQFQGAAKRLLQISTMEDDLFEVPQAHITLAMLMFNDQQDKTELDLANLGIQNADTYIVDAIKQACSQKTNLKAYWDGVRLGIIYNDAQNIPYDHKKRLKKLEKMASQHDHPRARIEGYFNLGVHYAQEGGGNNAAKACDYFKQVIDNPYGYEPEKSQSVAWYTLLAQ